MENPTSMPATSALLPSLLCLESVQLWTREVLPDLAR